MLAKIHTVLPLICRALWKAWRCPTPDPAYRMARIWSNRELAKFAPMFHGTVMNVSAGEDLDKEGNSYRDYFSSADTYLTTNFFHGRDARESEFFLDLEKEVDLQALPQADVVFNHTTLEHIYNVKTAFSTLALLTKDILIIVVPFMQQVHGKGSYNDYWRFTPDVIHKMFQENNLTLHYCSISSDPYYSSYIFCLGYRDKKWDEHIPQNLHGMMESESLENLPGNTVFKNSFLFRYMYYLRKLNGLQ